MKTLFFLSAKCAKTNQPFYIRHDFAADDRWVITYGVKELPSAEISFGGPLQIDYGSIRVGPQYKCPHCGNEHFVRCGACGKYTCHPCDETKKEFKCSYCAYEGTISGYIESVESCNSGNGQ